MSITGSTLEDRVQRIEKDLNAHERVHGKLRVAVRSAREEATAAVQAEVQARQAGDGETRALLEETAAGGLDLELVGLVWLLMGTLATNLTDERVASIVMVTN